LDIQALTDDSQIHTDGFHRFLNYSWKCSTPNPMKDLKASFINSFLDFINFVKY